MFIITWNKTVVNLTIYWFGLASHQYRPLSSVPIKKQLVGSIGSPDTNHRTPHSFSVISSILCKVQSFATATMTTGAVDIIQIMIFQVPPLPIFTFHPSSPTAHILLSEHSLTLILASVTGTYTPPFHPNSYCMIGSIQSYQPPATVPKMYP